MEEFPAVTRQQTKGGGWGGERERERERRERERLNLLNRIEHQEEGGNCCQTDAMHLNWRKRIILVTLEELETEDELQLSFRLPGDETFLI